MGIKKPGHTQTPNELFDEWLPDMSNTELRVTLVVIRQTLGWHRADDAISLTQFQKMTGLSRQGVISGLNAAIGRGTIMEAGTGKRGVKLYKPVYDDENTGQDNGLEESQGDNEINPTVEQTGQLNGLDDSDTSQLSRPDKPATSQLSRHTKEITTKEIKDSKKKDSTPPGVPPLFTTIEERYGVPVGEDWLSAYWEQNGIKPKKGPKHYRHYQQLLVAFGKDETQMPATDKKTYYSAAAQLLKAGLPARLIKHLHWHVGEKARLNGWATFGPMALVKYREEYLKWRSHHVQVIPLEPIRPLKPDMEIDMPEDFDIDRALVELTLSKGWFDEHSLTQREDLTGAIA